MSYAIKWNFCMKNQPPRTLTLHRKYISIYFIYFFILPWLNGLCRVQIKWKLFKKNQNIIWCSKKWWKFCANARGSKCRLNHHKQIHFLFKTNIIVVNIVVLLFWKSMFVQRNNRKRSFSTPKCRQKCLRPNSRNDGS